jgi:hypothetical protein
MTRGSTAKAQLRRSAAFVTLAASLALSTFAAGPASAAIQTDPHELYQTMRQAYDDGAAHGWNFRAQRYYEATVFDAGRSYALFNPNDPQNAEIAQVAVRIASLLHYDPLTDENASEWYVRSAAVWVQAHGDPGLAQQAQALLTRLDNADRDPRSMALVAQDDAQAVARTFARDPDALVQIIVADVRAYNLTKDARVRSDLLEDASAPGVPLVRVPDPEFGEMFAFVEAALHPGGGFTSADHANAQTIDSVRRNTPELRVIGRVHAIPHDVRLTRMAPADEYFGTAKLSPLGVRNELNRITKYLDASWGDRMSSAALTLGDAIEDWQQQYPHDSSLPQHLLEYYRLLQRVDSSRTDPEARKVRSLLLVQYAGSAQAQELSAS